MTNICKCYDVFLHRCSGTKEKEECYCCGDTKKCDFYEEVKSETKEHSCIIGYMYTNEGVDLLSVYSLIKEDIDAKEWNKYLTNNSLHLYSKILKPRCELSDLLNFRKNTSFKKFDYCPVCGKKIDWKEIKEKLL